MPHGRRSTPEAGRDRGSVGAHLTLALAAACALAACSEGTGPGSDEFTVTPEEATIAVGESVQLQAVGAPGPVTWTSDRSDVARVVAQTGFTRGVGRGTATVTATALGSEASASATITVQEPPGLGLSPTEVEFEIDVGGPAPPSRTVRVENTGDGSLGSLSVGPVTYGDDQPDGWLDATLGATAAPTDLILTVTSPDLSRGVYTASVPVHAEGVDDSPRDVTVTLSVVAPPSIVLSRSDVPMASLVDGGAEESVEVTNGGDRALTGLDAVVSYPAGGVDGWLQADLDGTEAPATLTLTADAAGLGTGSFDATVTVASDLEGVEAKDVTVTYVVSPGPAIGLDPTSVTLETVVGAADPVVDTVDVTNTGGGTLDDLTLESADYGQGEPGGWLEATLAGDEAPTRILLSASAGGLPEGTYSTTVAVASPAAENSPVELPVTLQVDPPPEISLSRTSVLLSGFQGGDDPGAESVGVSNSGGGELDGLSASVTYDGSGPGGWLAVQWSGGTTAPTLLQLIPDVSGLPDGTYSASVEVSTSVEGVESRTTFVVFAVRSFEADVYPLFNTDRGLSSTPCTNCHSNAQRPAFGASPSSLYDELLNESSSAGPYIVPRAPSDSRVYVRPSTDGSMALPSSDLSTLREWILLGAPFE